MAKKKEEKDEKKKGFSYSVELTGLLLILIAIIGLGDFGPMGNIINGFAIFIAGNFSVVILIYVFGIGLYMVLKRKMPEFFTSRLAGFYILLFAILVISHINYIKVHTATDALKETVNTLVTAFNDKYRTTDAGGGMLGALGAITFVKLFADGAVVVMGALIVFGVIMMFDVSIAETVKWIVVHIKSLFNKNSKDKEEIAKAEEEYSKDNKIVVSSLDELTQFRENKNQVPENFEENKQSDSTYILPPITLLNIPKKDQNSINQGNIKTNIEVLERVLSDFDISGKVVDVHVGPSVTQYELELKAGTKVNRILSLDREIALALAAKSVHIQAPIPGKNTVGIEIPNRINTMVFLRELLASIPHGMENSKLLAALGKDIMGKPIYAEINKTPHLLVAGATGSGKSVCINGIIASILMRAKPDEVKLLLIDPKKVELSIYNGVPHLLAPVVTDPKKASIALMKIVSEMDHRYDLFSSTETKSIAGYNQYVENKNKRLSDEEKLKKLPYIVVVIDELADLMLIAAKEVEESILRITQMARAAGIHLIVATQRPSTDVITGIIKANITSRIAFAVSSNVDSRTILDMAGAEKLLGKGDMLFKPTDENLPIRLQGTYISEEEVKNIVDFTIEQQKAQYDEKLTLLEEKTVHSNSEPEEYDDPLYNDIVEFAIRSGKISASFIQRKYRLGYNRAARIIDLLEERGIIGPANGSKPREVLVKLDEHKDDIEE